jgi:hypothetical protein
VILVALLFFFAAAPNRNTEKFWKNRRIINTSKNRKESQSTDFVNAKTSSIGGELSGWNVGDFGEDSSKPGISFQLRDRLATILKHKIRTIIYKILHRI